MSSSIIKHFAVKTGKSNTEIDLTLNIEELKSQQVNSLIERILSKPHIIEGEIISKGRVVIISENIDLPKAEFLIRDNKFVEEIYIYLFDISKLSLLNKIIVDYYKENKEVFDIANIKSSQVEDYNFLSDLDIDKHFSLFEDIEDFIRKNSTKVSQEDYNKNYEVYDILDKYLRYSYHYDLDSIDEIYSSLQEAKEIELDEDMVYTLQRHFGDKYTKQDLITLRIANHSPNVDKNLSDNELLLSPIIVRSDPTAQKFSQGNFWSRNLKVINVSNLNEKESIKEIEKYLEETNNEVVDQIINKNLLSDFVGNDLEIAIDDIEDFKYVNKKNKEKLIKKAIEELS